MFMKSLFVESCLDSGFIAHKTLNYLALQSLDFQRST
jgi:hypothetical protein